MVFCSLIITVTRGIDDAEKHIILSDSTLDYIKYTVVAAVYIGWEKFGLALG